VSLFEKGTGYISEFEEYVGIKLLRDERNMLEVILKTNLLEHVTFQSMSNIERLLGNCHKTAYIAKNTEIEKYLETQFRKTTKNQFYAGKEALLVEASNWHIQENGGKYMIRRMRYLEYFGIYYFWKNLLELQSTKLQKTEKPVKSLSLNSYIIVMIYAYCGLRLLHVL